MVETLTHRTVKNVIYSLIGFIWPLLLSFAVTPIIVKSLGSARFGFYALLNGLPMVFTLLDFGFSYTLVKQLSENRLNHSKESLSAVFSSTSILYALLGIVGFFVLFVFKGVFGALFKINAEFISSYDLAFFVIGLTFFIQMLTVPLVQIPFSLQRQDSATKVSMLNSVFLQLGSVLVLKTGHSVMALLIVQLFSAAFLFLSYNFIWRSIAPDLKFVPKFSKGVLRTIGSEGIWVFIRNNMVNILGQLDKFVLGAMWGPTAVGYYSTAQMIPEKISSTSFSLSHVFFPVFSEVSSETQEEKNKRVKSIFRRSFSVISIITAGLTVLVLLYGYQLVRFWVNEDFANNTVKALPILALTYLLLSFGNFFQSFLSGLKELKFLAVSIMILAVVDVIFMFLLIPGYSVNGASAAYLISALPMLPFLYYIERKFLKSEKPEIFNFYCQLFGKILCVSLITFGLGRILILPYISNLTLAVSLGGITFVLYFVIFWAFGFYSKEDENLVRSYIPKFFSFLNK